jgi:hypothetical protein
MKKNGGFWRSWVSGYVGKKTGNRRFWWPAVGGYGGERLAVVLRWWGRCGLEVGGLDFGFREEKGVERVSGCSVRQLGKMGKGGKTDLKAGHKIPKIEYVRNVQEYVRPYSCRCVSVCVRDTFELTGVSSNVHVQCNA